MEQLLADLYGPRRVGARGMGPGRGAGRRAPATAWPSVGAPAAATVADVVRRRRRRAAPTARGASCRTSTDTPDRHRLRPARPVGHGTRRGRAARGRTAPGTWPSISGFPAELRHALAGVSTVAEPAHRAVLTGGVDDAAYVEHSSLARQLGFHLVEAARPRRAQGPAVAAHARRARSDRRRVPAPVGRRPSTRSRSSATGSSASRAQRRRQPRAASRWPTPTAAGVLEDAELAAVLAGRHRRPDRARRLELAARWTARTLAAVAGAPRRPRRHRRRSSCGCTPWPVPTA